MEDYKIRKKIRNRLLKWAEDYFESDLSEVVIGSEKFTLKKLNWDEIPEISNSIRIQLIDIDSYYRELETNKIRVRIIIHELIQFEKEKIREFQEIFKNEINFPYIPFEYENKKKIDKKKQFLNIFVGDGIFEPIVFYSDPYSFVIDSSIDNEDEPQDKPSKFFYIYAFVNEELSSTMAKQIFSTNFIEFLDDSDYSFLRIVIDEKNNDKNSASNSGDKDKDKKEMKIKTYFLYLTDFWNGFNIEKKNILSDLIEKTEEFEEK